MKLTFLLLVAFTQISAATFGQQVTLKERAAPLERIFKQIQKQTGYAVFYEADAVEQYRVDVELKQANLETALKACLKDLPLAYKIVDKNILIRAEAPVASTNTNIGKKEPTVMISQQDSLITVRGMVSDSTRQHLIGVTVKVVGRPIQTLTDVQGRFVLEKVPRNTVIEISYVGYKTEQVKAFPILNIRLGQSTESMKEVVVTGLFNRKKDSFTGSATTFSQQELLEVGNINAVRSLANLDPSFRIMENLEFGSDPNRLPDIQLRGQTGFPDLNNEYGTNPNLPLFILDGFEPTLQRIIDLDIYLIKSMTILKDAASKAVYGSRAANGVVVVETIRPAAGKLQVTYNYNLNVELPDLSSYNLTDPMQKLQIEMMTDSRLQRGNAGLTTSLAARREYDAKLQEILRGVDTYWLSQPLRNGYGQRHSLTLGGGRDELQYYLEMGYNDIQGVMQESQRKNYSGGIQLFYRKSKFSVSNILRLNSSRGDNSPYGSFQLFAEQNPYIRLKDASGNYTFNSPMYNGTVGVQDFKTDGGITNNTNLVWNIRPFLRFDGRFGLTRTNSGTDIFLPASHNSFPRPNTSGYYDPNTMLRGSYTKSEGTQNRMNATLALSYNKAFGKSTVYANIGGDANSISMEDYGFRVVGFPNADLNFPAAAVQYAPNSRLSGTENKTRDMGFYTAINYAYDDRYLADLSWRRARSSQSGSDNPNATYWSAGLGWNIHKEAFMKDNGVFSTLRLTANTGYTGSQPLNAYLGYPV